MCQHCVGCNPECPECHPAWLEQPAARRCQGCQRLNPVTAATCNRCGIALDSLSLPAGSKVVAGYCQYVGCDCDGLCSMAQAKSGSVHHCVRDN